jgi:glycosyltransferase involved in cell wall biosynthesis
MSATHGVRLHSCDEPDLSVVIPVFNSEAIVAETVARTVGALSELGRSFEIVLVNDGSSDGSWPVVRGLAERIDSVIAIDLLRNYGQHAAIMCGLRHTRGRWVVTMDDDLQNPPEEIVALLVEGERGSDLVFGRFHRKEAGRVRSLGSRAIRIVVRRLFHHERDLTLSNFRLIRRDVVDRMAAERSTSPYITGLALQHATCAANASVRHDPRRTGRSTYTAARLARLVRTIILSGFGVRGETSVREAYQVATIESGC